jgi:hypothetical protein
VGYYTRFSLRALHPKTHNIVDPSTWSKTYHTSIVGNLDPECPNNNWDLESGDLFGSQEVKWYGYLDDMVKFSLAFPQFIWALRGIGENPNDEWILYAYRGSAYIEKQEPWTPPPPDMSRLPEVILMTVPKDPPSAEEALAAAKKLNHTSVCAVNYSVHGSECNCSLATIIEVLEAAVKARA